MITVPALAAVDRIANPRRHAIRLLQAIGVSCDPHGRTLWIVGHQRLFLALLVVIDQRTRRVQDGLGAAVVLFESDRAGISIVALKVEDDSNVAAAELVNRLVWVTNDTNIAFIHR